MCVCTCMCVFTHSCMQILAIDEKLPFHLVIDHASPGARKRVHAWRGCVVCSCCVYVIVHHLVVDKFEGQSGLLSNIIHRQHCIARPCHSINTTSQRHPQAQQQQRAGGRANAGQTDRMSRHINQREIYLDRRPLQSALSPSCTPPGRPTWCRKYI